MSIRAHVRRAVIRPVLLALALGTVPVVVSTATAEAAPYCGITWGSLAKSSAPMVAGPITNIRAGRHTCYDRLVIDLRGARPGYVVKYVSNVFADGSGELVPLRGGAKLQIIAKAPAYNLQGVSTYNPANQEELVNVTGYTTFRQVAWAGSFEGQSTVGLGVRARLPFRVFTLHDSATNTSRLVIDVAHRW